MATSLKQCTSALRADGRTTINAADFTADELEQAASVARAERASLIIYNLMSRPREQLSRVVNAGGRHVTLGDLHLI